MKLRDYQTAHAAKLLAIIKERHTALDASQTGTGKTYCAAWCAAQLNVPVLVICPLSVVPTWEKILADAGVKEFTVTNYEMAWRRLCKKVPWGKGSYLEWNETHPLFIYDECHRCQSRTTNQGKMLIASKRQIQKSGGMILCVSATAADSPLKMGPLGYAIDLHRLNDFFGWLDSHGCPEVTMGSKDNPTRQWKDRVFIKGKQLEVMAAINRDIYPSRGSRLRIAEIPEFPKTQIGVRLIDGHEKQVQRLSEEMKLFYAGKQIRAALSQDDLTKLIFLRQAMETAKVPALVDMIDDALLTTKVVVFANYRATLDSLAAECDKRGWTHGFIRGDQTTDERQAVIESFQDDRLDVCLANIQAGGVGVTLTSKLAYPRTALICPTWSAIDLRQSTGRVWRDGGGPSVQFLIYFLKTVEEQVAKSVERKLANIDQLNDGDLEAFL